MESNNNSSNSNEIFTGSKPLEENTEKMAETKNKWYSLTDIGNRDRFYDLNKNEIRFNIDIGKWTIWNGKKWEEDRKGRLSQLVDRTIMKIREALLKDAAATENPTLKKHIFRTESKVGIDSMIGLLESDSRMIMKNSDFDNKPYLFNCQNGTIELFEDGSYRFSDHNPKDYLTKISAGMYNPDATSQLWEEFLIVIFKNDLYLIKYFQKIIGYIITGNTDENVLFFLVGDGANGKSTVLEVLKLLLLDYCRKAKVDILIKNKGEATGMDLVRLIGARAVICTETDLGTSFDEGRIKDITGGDTLVARRLYKDFFEFKPEFKIIMYGNNKPRIKGNDFGIKRRIKIIPFLNRIPENQRIPQSKLINNMQNEFSGILNWILEGYRLYKVEGLNEPESVKTATSEYFGNLDVVGKFLDECCVIFQYAEIQVQQLYEGFKYFMNEIGEHPWTRNAFNEELLRRGFQKRVVGSRGTIWFGLTLKASELGITPLQNLPALDLPREGIFDINKKCKN